MPYDYYRHSKLRRPRNRSYGVVGVVVICLILLAVLLGAVGFEGPRVFGAGTAWLVGICLFALAFGVLYLLFTIRYAMREIREQGLALARLEVQEQRVEAARLRAGTTATRTTTTTTIVPSQTTLASPASSAYPTSPRPAGLVEVYRRPSRPVGVLEGVGPAYEARLASAGIATLSDMRAAPESRIQQATGVHQPTPHQWKAMANLMILNGVTAQAAELLARAGCEDVSDVAERDPAELHRELRVINESHDRRIYPDVLRMEDVRGWVMAARLGERRDLGYTSAAPSNQASWA